MQRVHRQRQVAIAAKLFGATRIEPDRIEVGVAQEGRARNLANLPWLPLPVVAGYGPPTGTGRDAMGFGAMYYAESWLLTHYMPAHYAAGWWMDSSASLAEAEEATYELFRGLKSVALTRNVLLPVGTWLATLVLRPGSLTRSDARALVRKGQWSLYSAAQGLTPALAQGRPVPELNEAEGTREERLRRSLRSTFPGIELGTFALGDLRERGGEDECEEAFHFAAVSLALFFSHSAFGSASQMRSLRKLASVPAPSMRLCLAVPMSGLLSMML